ncbi:hypothetical protein KEM60_00398 [Austwickia sp. TVS 96-490-7B]|uniref:hypothetical protein n=1 Tax=Austwickia sp. TVS 96-490-7B TaxID=2830843 RepID=UPI001C575400|nr:hypothetical protein [Austwickia sp. TVS 96-490-7B]MBW3084212.1 hypothetical protein [Austwickia sp. TVS 96-490-7B]
MFKCKKKKVAAGKASAVAAVAPKLEEAKARLESDVLPKVSEATSHVVDAVSDAVAKADVAKMTKKAKKKCHGSQVAHRAQDVVAAVTSGTPAAPKKRRRGRGLMTAVCLATVAGGIAWYVSKKAAPADDPWARPLADPYVPPTTGRESTVAPVAASPAVETPAPVAAVTEPEAPAVTEEPAAAPAPAQTTTFSALSEHSSSYTPYSTPAAPAAESAATAETTTFSTLSEHSSSYTPYSSPVSYTTPAVEEQTPVAGTEVLPTIQSSDPETKPTQVMSQKSEKDDPEKKTF